MKVAVVGHLEWVEFARVAAAMLGARCGAAVVTGRGPYAGQLSEAD